MSGCYCGNCYTWKLHSVEAEKLLWYEEKKEVALHKKKKKKRKKHHSVQGWGTFKAACTYYKGQCAHTHPNTDTHTHSLFFFHSLYWTEMTRAVCSRCFSQSPCWTARCRAGSSGGRRQSWRPATRRRGWRNPLAGPPPHTWTWAPGTSVHMK